MRPLVVAVGVAFALTTSPAFADDASTDGGAADGSVDAGEGIRESSLDNYGCAASGGAPLGAAPFALGFGVALVALVRRRRVVGALVLALGSLAASPARAEGSAPEDADLRAVRAEPPPARHLVLTVAPLGPMIGRWGGGLELLFGDHHGLGLSGAYVHSRTNEDTNNLFRGATFELGYRYYFGDGGGRGFFFCPSFLLGRLEAVPERGDSVGYWNLGGALDAGFAALAFDRVHFSLGAGVQYTAPTESFPAQELPASIYARPGVRPRLLLGLGVAF